MQNTPPTPQDDHHPNTEIAKDEAAGRASNPRRHYQSPEMLMADDGIVDAQKYDLLCEWKLDLDNRLKAEEEGMGASDPMDRRDEARIAAEHARVNNLLTELGKSLGRA